MKIWIGTTFIGLVQSHIDIDIKKIDCTYQMILQVEGPIFDFDSFVE